MRIKGEGVCTEHCTVPGTCRARLVAMPAPQCFLVSDPPAPSQAMALPVLHAAASMPVPVLPSPPGHPDPPSFGLITSALRGPTALPRRLGSPLTQGKSALDPSEPLWSCCPSP